MRQEHQNGYAIILALLATALIGMALMVLVDTSSSLLFDSQQQHVQSWGRNLSASALAWARVNSNQRGEPDSDRSIELDLEHLNIPGGRLQLIWLPDKGKSPRVQIHSQCRRGKITVKDSAVYLLTAAPSPFFEK